MILTASLISKALLLLLIFIGHDEQHHPPNRPSQSFHQPPLISYLSPSGMFGLLPTTSPTTPP